MSIKLKLKGRGRPATGRDSILGLRAPDELRERIDAWAAKQADQPGRSEAIRRLIELALSTASTSMRPGSRRSHAKSAELANVAIEGRTDPLATRQERASRTRQLLKGPKEFRDIRKDHPDE